MSEIWWDTPGDFQDWGHSKEKKKCHRHLNFFQTGWSLTPWTCSLFCGCICCCRHLCLWFKHSSSPIGNINDLNADWSCLVIKNYCWELFNHFTLQICKQNLGTMCHSLFTTVDTAPGLAVTALMQPMFLDGFPGCLLLIRGPKQPLSWCKFCGVWAVWRSVVVELPVVIGCGIYCLAKQCHCF